MKLVKYKDSFSCELINHGSFVFGKLSGETRRVRNKLGIQTVALHNFYVEIRNKDNSLSYKESDYVLIRSVAEQLLKVFDQEPATYWQEQEFTLKFDENAPSDISSKLRIKLMLKLEK